MTAAPRSFLVVDDEPDNCLNLADLLEDLGYHVDTAQSGDAALRLVEARHYDAAILDLMMPGMDGTALFAELKKRHPAMLAFLATAYPGHPRAAEALEAGVRSLVPKPVDFRVLLQLLEAAVSQPLLLVVDDDADLCAGLSDILQECGYRTCTVHDVAGAVDHLNRDEYQILLLDMKLPDGEGLQVFQKSRECQPPPKVMVISGCLSNADPRIQQMLAGGASGLFEKPIDYPRFLRELDVLTRQG